MPRGHYERRAASFAALERELAGRAERVTNARLAAFLTGAAGLLWLQAGGGNAPALGLALLGAGGYCVLVLWHRRLRRRTAWANAQLRLAHDGLHRLERAWDRLPRSGLGPAPADHPYAADLDILGHASVGQLLGPVATPAARNTLRAWLLTPADAGTIRARQAAAGELAAMSEQRHELAALGRLAGTLVPQQSERFLDWAERAPWLLRTPLVLWAARLLPLVTVAFVALALGGALGTWIWLAPVALALVLTGRHARRLKSTFHAATPADTLRDYVALFRFAEALTPATAPLVALQRRLIGAADALERLRRILHLADLRLSLLHFVAQLAFLWDFHIVWLLERWAAAYGRSARDWLSALGELEALAALGTLAFDEPDWCWPVIEEGEPRLVAEALAHPMLRPGQRVPNDVRLGPPGTFLLVTGSNMAGKSTLLRALGTNAVLAQCGAPACAAALRLTALRVWTSMRIRDSLATGVSLFMAEVQRLRGIVDATEEDNEAAVLFLLDEILQGTNLEEHRIGARWILSRLTAARAIGAVATHDLDIAAEPPLEVAARAVHVREQLRHGEAGPELDFDYALRPGLATSRNALVIMRLAGLHPRPDAS